MRALDVPFVIRGRVVTNCTVEHVTGATSFRTPDPHDLLSELPLSSRTGMADLHAISLSEIIDFLAALGDRLRLSVNEHVQRAFDVGREVSGLTEPLLRSVYEDELSAFFDPSRIRDAVERRLGAAYIEGWVHEPSVDGRDVRVRAFGSRATHVVAGNHPGVTAQTIVRNAVTRSDAIIKTPSNDPVTAVAIAQTMVDLDPDHPITRHVTALHWRGGDEVVERVVFAAPNIDKIVAWGGGSAIRHVASFVGPGVELIALDPKISISLLGSEALATPAEAARRLALDVGAMNQQGCVSSRVAYLDVSGIEEMDTLVRTFAEAVFAELQVLPADQSSPAARLPADLRDEIDSALLLGDPEVVGGGTAAGGVVITWDGRPVDFTAALTDRYVNLVPVRGFAGAIEGISSRTQTCGVYPEDLRTQIRDLLALAGVQRVKPLGVAGGDHQAIPQDGMEILRRMCRWIVDEA